MAVKTARLSDRLFAPLRNRLKREWFIFFLMGQRSLLMQIAHPTVALAVKEHSSFREQPIQRLTDTFALSMKLFTGSDEEAAEAAANINRRHQTVKGRGYNARDPELGKWVWATLVEAAILGHELFVEPLARQERQTMLDTFRDRAALLGLSGGLPSSEDELYDYMAQMILSGEVRVSPTAHELATMILGPVPPPLHPLTGYLARATLPDLLRDQYDLSWSPFSELAFSSLICPFTQRVTATLTPGMICLAQ